MSHEATSQRLTRCSRCGEVRGASCLCDRLVCGACGRDRIRRPISDYYDLATNEIIHVPWFMGLKRCRVCGAQSNWVAARLDHDGE